jgi:hypothetical protein
VRNVDALFFMLVWTRVGPQEACGTRYGELVFLHPVRSGGHVVRFGASGSDMSTHYFSYLGRPGAGPT